ncbi:hypothetical protein RHSIM_Rhsim05G0046100 [Rhododendron simsii]|uniref:Uncharacterized protein n=1 Tax=Rhododendron simsii TaxID=118357 RepID=A0A834GX06_RHOSS|nr:hypothetical protein RHSIM_Rhsim05G0046100 [Rhododendron simsii]
MVVDQKMDDLGDVMQVDHQRGAVSGGRQRSDNHQGPIEAIGAREKSGEGDDGRGQLDRVPVVDVRLHLDGDRLPLRIGGMIVGSRSGADFLMGRCRALIAGHVIRAKLPGGKFFSVKVRVVDVASDLAVLELPRGHPGFKTGFSLSTVAPGSFGAAVVDEFDSVFGVVVAGIENYTLDMLSQLSIALNS